MPEGTVQETRDAIQLCWGKSYGWKEKNSEGTGISWGKIPSFNERPRRHEKRLDLGL